MFDFIREILGAERNSVSNRLEKYGKLSTQTGLSINLTLKEALALMPRNRKRIDAYAGLVSYLKREYGITLIIKSQKTKS